MTPETRRRSTAIRRGVRLFLAAHLFFPLAWLSEQGSAAQVDRRDWYYVRLAGERFLDGRWARIYSSVDNGFLWRYPPFALFLAAGLAVLHPRASYWLVVVVALLAVTGTLLLLGRTLRPEDLDLVWLATIGSAAFTSVIVSGQNSALLALTIAAALWSLERGRALLPFGLLGLLAFKPNWLPVFGLMALVRRWYAGLAAMTAVAVALVLSSLPLGLDLWNDFLEASLANDQLLADFPAYKLATAHAVINALVADQTLVWVMWSLIVAVLIGSGLLIWRPESPVPLSRQLGVAVLITVAANLYVAFYDELVLVVPATVWWATRDTYASPRTWRAIGFLIATIWIWDYAVFYYANLVRSLGLLDVGPPSFSAVGPALVAWITLEAVDAWRGRVGVPPTARQAS